MALPIAPQPVGHIVALEGPSELVSTQLRLLPTSPHIFILPSLEHYLSDTSLQAPFDARRLLLHYHKASQARHAEAMEFLRPSTATDEKRLVFMHGGALSAQVACLSTIMEHEVEGSIEEAHATFIRLASNGIAGLSSTLETTGGDKDPKPAASSEGQGQQGQWGAYRNAVDDAIEDPIVRAMRAADALYKETEFLQPLTPDVGLTVKLVDIPSRSKKRASPTAGEPSEALRGPRLPSPRHAQPQNSAQPESVPHVSPDGSSTGEAASATSRKPHLRIRIPTSHIPGAGHVAADASRKLPSKASHRRRSSGNASQHRGSQTAGPSLSSTQRPASIDSAKENILWMARLDTESQPAPGEQREAEAPTDSPACNAADTEKQPSNAVLPLLEDLVVLFTPEPPNELHEFVFRRLSEGCKSRRPSAAGPLSLTGLGPEAATDRERLTANDARDNERNPSMGAGVSGEPLPWVRKDLVHGLPTPNHSPTPFDAASMSMSLGNTRFCSIRVGEKAAVSVQNYLRSLLASQFPLQDRRLSTRDNAESPAEAGLWRHLGCDPAGKGFSDGQGRLDMILAVGAESGVRKSRLSEVVGQLEKLGFKTSGLSRSGRLDIRYLIVKAMQVFTAQPLTKQMQNNPFADRTLLAVLILPHLGAYLANHPDVRFLLIEYPSEHLSTVLALQTLIGTEMMKVVGIINSDAPTPVQSPPIPDRRPSEGFRSLSRRGPHIPGAFVGSCSFSEANFLLASSATGLEAAAFVAAVRENLISISDFYIPDRPLYKPPTQPSPPKRPYPSVQGKTKAAGTTSHPRKEAFRASVSRLIITPPSSPSEPSLPTHPTSPSSPPSSSSSTALPAGGDTGSSAQPTNTNLNTSSNTATGSSATSTRPHIHWGKINYAPASAPSATATAADTGARCHKKQDSAPLSPRAVAMAVADADRDGDDDGDDDDDDMQDEEVRRLMPLFLRTREEIERGRSSKALKWLGLA